MLVKILWYFAAFFTVFFVLIDIPNNNNVGPSMSQSQLFNMRSNKFFMQKLIGINVFMFFILTILSLV
uniref:Preprotein-translocase subunit g n=1 Tax=Polysiphonia sp. TaxID=1967842 RepID=A0A1Z1M3M2_9FLOR|nr:preprotein-translocase subunit g [Polysiphonia sp.]